MTERPLLTQISDDIYQLRLPLPFALNHVNVYLLNAPSGWTIVDCGINWDKGRQVWQYAFDELRFSGADIEQIVLTHVHPDHFGLAGWLYQLAQSAGRDIQIKTSQREIEQAQAVWGNERIEFKYWLSDNGMPPDMADDVDHSMGDTYKMTLPHAPHLTALDLNQPIKLGERLFKPIFAPGHSDGQILFYDASEKLLLSGDHVLMKITPNIGLWENTDSNPLGAFMASLRDLSSLDVDIALPGHRNIIEDWSGRISELLLHHEQRLDLVIAKVSKGHWTPYQIANHLFDTGRFTTHEWRFAIAETLAHLDYLRVEGKIKQADDEQVFSV